MTEALNLNGDEDEGAIPGIETGCLAFTVALHLTPYILNYNI